jgi:hypothetical protein
MRDLADRIAALDAGDESDKAFIIHELGVALAELVQHYSPEVVR